MTHLNAPSYLFTTPSYDALRFAIFEYAQIGDIGFVQLDESTYFSSLPEWKASIWDLTVVNLREQGFTLDKESVPYVLQGFAFDCQEYRASNPDRRLYLNRNKRIDENSQYDMASNVCQRMHSAGLWDFVYRCLHNTGIIKNIKDSVSVSEARKTWFTTGDPDRGHCIKLGGVAIEEFDRKLLLHVGLPNEAIRDDMKGLVDVLPFENLAKAVLAKKWLSAKMLQLKEGVKDAEDIDPAFANNAWRQAVVDLVRQGEGTLVSNGVALQSLINEPQCQLLDVLRDQSAPRFNLAQALAVRLKMDAMDIFASSIEPSEMKKMLTLPPVKILAIVKAKV